MNRYSFEFYPQPIIWKWITAPLIFAVYGIIIYGLFSILPLIPRIILIIFLLYFVYKFYNQGVKKVCFNESEIHILHFNGKITPIRLDEISQIQIRKFAFYDPYYTHCASTKKGSTFKRRIDFFVPDEYRIKFDNYLDKNSIKCKYIGYQL